jgi:hypothetical protein
MIKSTIIVDNHQKKRAFSLIQLVMKDFSSTLNELRDRDASNDLFMKTTKNLILNFNQEVNDIIGCERTEFQISTHSLNIFKDTIDFYWQTARNSFNEFTENDYVNAQRLLSTTPHNIFVKK